VSTQPASPGGPYAVIDVGAHSVRLQVSQLRPDGSIELLDSAERPVPLGEDVFRRGAISIRNMRLVSGILRDFSRLMTETRVQRVRAFATSAVREAENRDFFLDNVAHESHIRLEVLSAAEEIRLVFLAIEEALGGRFDFKQRNAVICLVGTGATQLCFTENGLLTHAETARLGTIRVVEQLAEPVSPARLRQFIDPFIGAVVSGVARISDPGRPRLFLALGSAVRALVSLNHIPEDANAAVLSRRRFRQTFETVAGVPPAQLAVRFHLSDTIAQSLEPCCNMLDHVFDITETDRMIIPLISTRDAVVRDLVRIEQGAPDAFEPHIRSATRHLAQKFSADMAHAETVAAFALRLFDVLGSLHGLSARDRLLLEVAAILHDVGLFISNRTHHKHSFYLVRSSELPGISPEEQELVAVVVRYHRRAMPAARHPEYMAFPLQDRLRIARLAAILRVADALDRRHQQRFPRIEVELHGEDELILAVHGSLDLTLENWGLRRKADLFEQVFGRRVNLVTKR